METTTQYLPHEIYLRTAQEAVKTGKARGGDKESWIIAITFAALAIEAFANETIARIFPDIADDLDKISPCGKIFFIIRELKLPIEKEHSPWQHIRPTIAARNLIAHSKPKSREKFEMTITEENAEKALLATAAIRVINKHILPEQQRAVTFLRP